MGLRPCGGGKITSNFEWPFSCYWEI